MSTITAEQHAAIAAFLTGRHIPAGIGTPKSACSIAAAADAWEKLDPCRLLARLIAVSEGG